MSRAKEKVKPVHFQKCAVITALEIIGGKWRLPIIWELSSYESIRYNELKRNIGTISHKTLSLALKALEKDGVIVRKEYPQIPPKVEYSLSLRGESLIPILDIMCKWGEENCNWFKEKLS